MACWTRDSGSPGQRDRPTGGHSRLAQPGAASGMNKVLWYLSRATGVASIVLLTAVLVLGMLTASRRSPSGVRSAVVMGLHRALALGASAFLVVHIATASGHRAKAVRWTARQARSGRRCRSNDVTTTAAVRSTARVPKPTQAAS